MHVFFQQSPRPKISEKLGSKCASVAWVVFSRSLQGDVGYRTARCSEWRLEFGISAFEPFEPLKRIVFQYSEYIVRPLFDT